MSFWAFVKWYPFRPEIKPFTFGLFATWFMLGPMMSGGTAEAKKDSKYLNPPKHH
jgi:hypothetical protein